jgi:flavin reductase (DIM6/NTAB) family NADH-FMN oxidoreductase RutF
MDLKVDVPKEHWDRLFSPPACVVMITTVDGQGRVNAASFATCVRVNHEPTCIAFAVDTYKDTCKNVLATGEFVVNIPFFDREILEKVRVVGLPFAPGVNELTKAGLSAIPSKVLRPPRIAECKSHFECTVEWTKEWLNRLMVVGRVVAASVNRDCIDKDGYVLFEKFKPAHFCGHAYHNKFVASYQVMEVAMIYQGPEAEGQK